MSKCEHGLTSAECFVCASPKYAAAPQQQASDIHSCRYYCTRPEGIRAQRDELRDKLDAQQQAEPVAITDEHIETFVLQYNDVYCHQRKAGVGGGDAERAAMRQVLILALGAYRPRITDEQIAELKRLADEYAKASSTPEYNDEAEPNARAALHAALDALVKETP